MSGEDNTEGLLPPGFVFWWVAAFIVLILILIVATFIALHSGDREEPCP